VDARIGWHYGLRNVDARFVFAAGCDNFASFRACNPKGVLHLGSHSMIFPLWEILSGNRLLKIIAGSSVCRRTFGESSRLFQLADCAGLGGSQISTSLGSSIRLTTAATAGIKSASPEIRTALSYVGCCVAPRRSSMAILTSVSFSFLRRRSSGRWYP
jgi:hypothetical protein